MNCPAFKLIRDALPSRLVSAELRVLAAEKELSDIGMHPGRYGEHIMSTDLTFIANEKRKHLSDRFDALLGNLGRATI